jgi:pimeloyl-ACP methyl ester carboxylesterase
LSCSKSKQSFTEQAFFAISSHIEHNRLGSAVGKLTLAQPRGGKMQKIIESFDRTKIAFRSQAKLTPALARAGRIGVVVACSGDAFTKFEEVMNQAGATVMMDMRGSGASERPKSKFDYSVPAYAKDITAVMRANKTSSTFVVGYSHGAEAVAHLAINDPKRVSALVLIEPPFFADRSFLIERARLAEQGQPEEALRLTFSFVNPGMTGRELEEGVKSVLANYGDSAEGLAGEFRARAMFNIGESQLAQISVPTLVIGGTESNIREDVARTAAAIPNASLFWLRGATHFLTAEDGRRAAEITQAFLANI